ncbi:serine O-acetyltransferase [Deinococcus radiophilus]|uniref:Serine acetyltransferase n=1 Tax=Deinococcus radiophilus TaxID=32062 RepID=A0A3S0I618_9DEIO|nr:serine O-acetyltransferase [Deinococcus radiophilus]RTR25598.1 serine acetyltransferase [Deinococcus radiophilus]UFA51686.1 serine O-acetyltransferase [Deinococcus radiophilus]
MTALSDDFLQQLMTHHREGGRYPPSEWVVSWAEGLLYTLFPEQTGRCIDNAACLRAELLRSEVTLARTLTPLAAELPQDAHALAGEFMAQLPELYALMMADAHAMWEGDPAARSHYEVIRAYPGFYAASLYRIAHRLHCLGVPLLPRLITERAHSRTGIDIHPGAVIGERFCIDHGTGIVIGETAQIANDVKLYQGVTLGALSVDKDMAGTKRHPTLHSGVIVYAGATILGGQTVIGQGSVIGGNVWVTRSVPPGAKVYYKGELDIRLL